MRRGFSQPELRECWVLEVHRVERILRDGEVYLAVYVNYTNMGRKEWYVDSVKHFTLVLEDSKEVKMYGTSLWGGFYYIKTGESLEFYVVFPAGDARPARLVVSIAGRGSLNVQRGGPVYRIVLIQIGYEVVGTGVLVRYGRGFVCRQRDFFGPAGPPQLPAPSTRISDWS